jgi:hypothetical protein
VTAIQTRIADEARRQGVRPELALAVAQKESSFNPGAVGDNGAAVGLFQLHAAAAQDAGISPEQRWDIDSNIRAGVAYLRQQLARFGGDEAAALQAYNGGAANVERGTVSSAAQSYAADVLRRVSGFASSLLTPPDAVFSITPATGQGDPESSFPGMHWEFPDLTGPTEAGTIPVGAFLLLAGLGLAAVYVVTRR